MFSMLHPGSTARAETRRRRRAFTCRLLLCLFSLVFPSQAQKEAQKAERRVVYKTPPEYPVLLKQARIGGVVRLQIVISPRGSVDSVVALGGNAVLVESATRAVKKWKYVPADSESKTQVDFVFDPTH